MNPNPAHRRERGSDLRDLRGIAQRAFSRAASAPLVSGNAVRLLLNAPDNYEAWLGAIQQAQQAIYFENYMIHADQTGMRFRDALVGCAEKGIKVRVLHDWLGSFRTAKSFWAPLEKAGGVVRIHNPLRIDTPLAWLSRDHRKSLVVDGQIGFVSGICVSDMWLGNPARGIEPWRDTGVEIRGPAVMDLISAFQHVWAECGEDLSKDEIEMLGSPAVMGDVDVRVVATAPNLSGLYRLDLLIAAIAQKQLWLTDAYFAGVPAYVQALRAAARDGVDVRLLVPGGSDLPWLRPISTAGYRPLLEAGVRVFEWNGSMLHAKTAVADHRWARVGSTNLNLASWLTNYELDVAIENEAFAKEMGDVYEKDLEHSTEIVLHKWRRVRLKRDNEKRSKPGRGSLARATAGALRLSRTVSAAVLNRRVLGPTEARSLAVTAFIPMVGAIFAAFFPQIVGWTVSVFLGWMGCMLLLRAWSLYRAQKNQPQEKMGSAEKFEDQKDRAR